MKIKKLFYLSIALATVTLAAGNAGCSKEARISGHLKRAEASFKTADYDRAEIEFLKVLQADPQNPAAIKHLGIIYFNEGRFDRAFSFVAASCQRDTNNFDLHINLGQIYLSAGKFNAARAEAETVLAANPHDSIAPLLLAESCVTPADLEKAQMRLQQLPENIRQTAAVQLGLGTLAFRRSDFESAGQFLKHAETLAPGSSEIHLTLANLYWTQKNLDGAKQEFQNAIDAAPSDPAKQLKLAQFEIQSGDAAAGKRLLKQIIGKHPAYLPAQLALAEIAATGGNDAECDKLLGAMLTRDGANYGALLLDGRVKLANGKFSEAAAVFERMEKFYPDSPPVCFQLAQARLADNETAAAIRSLKRALSLDTNFAEADLLLAEIKIKTGDVEAATASLKRLTQQRPDLIQSCFLLADIYRANGQFDNALGIYRQAGKNFPRNPRIPFQIGLTFLQQNRKAEARAEFERALALSPDYAPALERLLDFDIAEKQFSAASRRIEEQLAQHPKSPELQLLSAKVFFAQGDTNRTEAALLKATGLQPDLRAAHLLLAQLYENSHQPEKALEHLRFLATKNTNDVDALMCIGTILEQQKNYSGARDVYEKLLAVDPKFAPALNNLACLYADEFGQLDRAYALASSARNLLPDNPSVSDTLGWVLCKKGQYAWSLSLLRESANELPGKPEVQFHLGVASNLSGDREAARIAFRRALQSGAEFPDRAECERQLAGLSKGPPN
ncbi:MAG TPA: tetratricopeptide repeat protein [Verrucomicrobiae bacterium]|nr:tetratricopeptide repeat protein [Verrucomicrobiae bacterium]